MDFISQLINEVVESVVEERWMPIVGFEKYQVSDLGRIKNKSGKILKCENKDEYIRVTLYKKSKSVHRFVHRLVLQAFNPMEEDLECDHINHIKSDNRLVNLRWVTKSQNSRFQKKREGCLSQYLGVSWYKRGNKWRAMCRLDGKNLYFGCFETEEEAAKAYNDFVISKGLQDFVILNEIN